MQGRKAEVSVLYNGQAVKVDFQNDISSFSYTDPAEGESDSLSLTLADPLGRWTSDWFPVKGDRLEAMIELSNWPGNTRLKCGAFVLDSFSMSAAPQTVSLGAVSAPADVSFSAAERSRTWEKITVEQIAGDIAGRYGLSLAYDGPEVMIAALEQSKETDSAFLQRVCEQYGLCLKIYAKKLVIFSRKEYKDKGAVYTIRQAECKSWSYTTKLEGTYTGGSVTYTDPGTEKDIVYEKNLGAGRDLLINQKADSPADAQKILESALEKANHGMTTMQISMMGGPVIVSGQCVNLSGFGRLDGKYYVDQAAHSVSGSGYELSLELALIA